MFDLSVTGGWTRRRNDRSNSRCARTRRPAANRISAACRLDIFLGHQLAIHENRLERNPCLVVPNFLRFYGWHWIAVFGAAQRQLDQNSEKRVFTAHCLRTVQHRWVAPVFWLWSEHHASRSCINYSFYNAGLGHPVESVAFGRTCDMA